MTNPLSLLRHSYVARTTLLLVGSDLFSKGAVFLLQMYLARVFDKGAMGSLSYCMTIILLTSAVVDLGVNSSLVRFASERLAAGRDAGGVVRLALRLKLLTGTLVVAIGLVTAPLIDARYFPEIPAHSVVLASFAGGVALALGSLASSIFVAWRMVPREVLIRGLATALKVGAVAAAVALSRIPSWQTVVFILSLFPFITAGAFYRFLPRELFSGPPLAGGERRDVIRFSLTFGAGGALWLGAVYSPVFIVFALAGETQAAHYYLSNQLVMPALILLSQYMSVMSARTSRAASAAEARSLQKRSLPYLAGFVFVLAVVFIASRPLMALVWSEKYRESAPTFQALLTAMAIQVIQVPVEMLITYHKRGGILLTMNGICAGSTVLFSVLLAPTHGAEGCALAFAGSLAVSRVVGLAILVRSGLLPPRSRATR